MDSRAKEVLKIGNKMFTDKHPVDSLWQEIALQFYPERADFTTSRSMGEEYSDHLFSSYTVLARRELANLFSANLRPRTAAWFNIHAMDDRVDKGREERAFLERMTFIQRMAMYDPPAQFVRATKEGDHDFATFGNAVIRVRPNLAADGLLFITYHLRDCAWSENAEGRVDNLHRKWTPTARQLKQHFPDAVSNEVNKAYEKDPEKTFECRHVVLPARLYDYRGKLGKRYPFVELTVECEKETVLEEVGLNYFCYVVPRWQVVSGSPYGRSMATDVALPDGRTIQVVTRVLREAGEKYVDPPMIGVGDAIRGDMALYPGGFTNVDMEYDERLGEVLRPISQDRGGMPIGFEIATALREDIRMGFFLDKIQLPETKAEMTAYETRRRIEQGMKAQIPLFEPIEHDYNAPLCETVFQALMEHRAFGSLDDMPASLQNQDVKFQFRSPMSEMVERNEAETFIEGMERVIIPAAQVDPALLALPRVTESTRDALRAIGWKEDWINDISVVAQRRDEMQKEAEAQKGMVAIGAGAEALQKGAKGAESLQKAGVA